MKPNKFRGQHTQISYKHSAKQLKLKLQLEVAVSEKLLSVMYQNVIEDIFMFSVEQFSNTSEIYSLEAVLYLSTGIF